MARWKTPVIKIIISWVWNKLFLEWWYIPIYTPWWQFHWVFGTGAYVPLPGFLRSPVSIGLKTNAIIPLWPWWLDKIWTERHEFTWSLERNWKLCLLSCSQFLWGIGKNRQKIGNTWGYVKWVYNCWSWSVVNETTTKNSKLTPKNLNLLSTPPTIRLAVLIRGGAYACLISGFIMIEIKYCCLKFCRIDKKQEIQL